MMRPEEGEGGVPEPPGDATDNTAEDQAAITGPVSADRSDQAGPRQPNDVNRPVQLPIPGLDVGAGEDVDDLQWRADAEAELNRQMAQDEDIRADQLTAKVGLPFQRNLVGNLFVVASTRGELRRVGYTHSKSSSRHGGLISVWRAA